MGHVAESRDDLYKRDEGLDALLQNWDALREWLPPSDFYINSNFAVCVAPSDLSYPSLVQKLPLILGSTSLNVKPKACNLDDIVEMICTPPFVYIGKCNSQLTRNWSSRSFMEAMNSDPCGIFSSCASVNLLITMSIFFHRSSSLTREPSILILDWISSRFTSSMSRIFRSWVHLPVLMATNEKQK